MVHVGGVATVRTGHAFDSMAAVSYQLSNHLGSVSVRLGSSGTTLDREEYYPFGDSSVRTWSKKRYRYVGKEKDAESGLYYYGARYYSAWTSRFISVDPLVGKTFYQSSYVYADNNPIMMNDPTGMSSEGGGDEPKGGNQQSGVGQKQNETTQKTQTHSVQSGETLGGIAKKHGTTIKQLYKDNPNLPSDPTKLQVGTDISIGGSSARNDNINFKLDLSWDVAKPFSTRVAMSIIPDFIPAAENIDTDGKTKTEQKTEIAKSDTTKGDSTEVSPYVRKQLDHIFKSEGGYVDDPDDAGGKTKYGIAEKREWPQAAEYLGIDPDPKNIKTLTKGQAEQYYIHSRFEEFRITDIKSEKIANAVLDQSILTPGLINKNIKKSLNSLGYEFDVNSKQLTNAQIKALNTVNADKVVVKFVSFQDAYFKSLNNAKYEKGWLNRTARLKTYK